jgi:hypothetical protein
MWKATVVIRGFAIEVPGGALAPTWDFDTIYYYL